MGNPNPRTGFLKLSKEKLKLWMEKIDNVKNVMRSAGTSSVGIEFFRSYFERMRGEME